jgi:hypothetical protein
VVAEPIKTAVEQGTVVAVEEEEAEITSLYVGLSMQTGPMVPVVSNTTTGLL